MGAIDIAYDSPEEQARGEALRADKVWAELGVLPRGGGVIDSCIDVWWPRERNRDRAMTDPFRAIGGKGTDGSGGWMPLSLTNCRQLRELFGDDLEVSDALNEWACNEIDRLAEIESLAESTSDADLSPAVVAQAPAIASVAHPYQRAGVAFCATTRRALLADQPGLGKTLQTIGAVIEAGIEGDILVLAPKAAVDVTWPEQLARWVPGDEVVAVTGTGGQRHRALNAALSVEPATPRRWIVCNLEMARAVWVKPTREFRKPLNDASAPKRWIDKPGWWDYRYPELFGTVYDPEVRRDPEDDTVGRIAVPPWASIVVDESHRALITTNAHPQGQTQVRAGIGKLAVASEGLRLALSGTPFRGKPENLWGTLNWLYPERYSAFWTWARQWFVVYGVPGQETEIGALDESKSGDFYRDIQPIMLRRTKREVRPELPDKLYAGTPLALPGQPVDDNSPVGHWLHMEPRQAAGYADMRDDAETQLESGTLVANGVLAELTRLKQFATCYGDITEVGGNPKFVPQLPSAKFDWLVEFLAERGIDRDTDYETTASVGNGDIQKVVVASQFTSVLNLYEAELKRLGIPVLMITGQVTGHKRKLAAETWQADGGPRVFLLNTNAGGVSLTLDAADDLIFLDETWIPDDQEQVEDRIHRVSRLHQVTIHYLRTLGTVEENIAYTTGSRERLIKKLIDGERGATFAKSLLTPIER